MIARRPKLALPNGKSVAIDTETTGLSVWHGDQPFAVSFCNEVGDTAYVEWPVDPYTRVVEFDLLELEQVIDFILEHPSRKVFHNAKFDIRMLETASMENFGVELFDRKKGELKFNIDETTFMAWCCNGMEPNFKLKSLANRYLDYPVDDEEDLKKLVNRLRRKAKKEDWKTAYSEDLQDDGTIKYKAVTAADYWLPREAERRHPEWLGIKKIPARKEAAYCGRYCVADAERTMLLKMMYNTAMEEEGVTHTYLQERDELWPITWEIEDRGIHFLRDKCEEEEAATLAELKKYKQEVINAAWPEFTGKPKEMQILLYDRKYLGLPVRVRTKKTQQPATNVDALTAHEDHPVIRSIQKWRAAHKGWSTYFRRYNKLSVPTDDGWEMHGEFRQLYPVTRRYASSAPNMQNVANALTTRSQEPIQARTVFAPRPGYVWYHWDYHQVEVRIFADLAQEPFMLDALANNRDLHDECTNKAWGGEDNPAAIWAAAHSLEFDGTGPAVTQKSKQVMAIWKKFGIKKLRQLSAKNVEEIAYEWLSWFDFDIVAAEASLKKKTSRAKAKMLLFAKQFGGGPNAVKDLLRVSWEEAAQFLDDYSVAFPRIDEWIAEVSEEGRENGYVLDNYNTKLAVNREKAYQGANRKVQGSAASLLKRAMVRCREHLRKAARDARIVLTVHDELAFEIRKTHAHRNLIMDLGYLMADHEGHFNIPTPVELERVTKTWNQKEKVPWCIGQVFAKEAA